MGDFMATDENNDKARFERFIKRRPILSVHSDAPLSEKTPEHDRFKLITRLGPVYDILRHKDTSTPLAIQIHGDWGSGKSSAMRWLQGCLNRWGTDQGEDHIVVRTVWFDPWKYHTRDDVWRGLIAEVVLHFIDVRHLDRDNATKRLISAAGEFGRFLGRSFLHTLKAISLQGSGVEAAPGQAIDAILSDYHSTAHPERAYLNEFESTLQSWIKRYIGKNERLVIFIDDLDRCMPEVALEVLEALKLYLNIERLIFVVGVAPNVVNALVQNHYDNHGVPKVESANYLAKMFQVEVPVSADYKQIESFLDDLLKGAGVWKMLAAEHQTILRDCLRKLSRVNPREVKRMVNEVLICGTRVLIDMEMSEESSKDHAAKLLFAQTLQRALIGRILDRESKGDESGDLTSRYGRYRRRIDEENAHKFFYAWSEAIRPDPERKCSFPTVAYYADRMTAGVSDGGLAEELKKREINFPQEYAHFWAMLATHSDWAALLVNEDIGELMRIEYPSEANRQRVSEAQTPPTPEDELSDMRQAIAHAEKIGSKGDPRFADPTASLRDPKHPHWVTIPAGEFWMGAQSEDAAGRNYDKEAASDESPVHQVTLRAYAIGRYPVTVSEYKAFVDAGGYDTKRYWYAGGLGKTSSPGDWDGQLQHPTRPVVGVSWFEAMAFAAWATSMLENAGHRSRITLPTEAQWERAARGLNGRRYPWGNDEATEHRLNFDANVGKTTPVGVYDRGATPEGIHDMAGNVWEWCLDWFGGYMDEAVTDPTGPNPGPGRVLRGGSWYGYALYCRSAYRDGDPPDFRDLSIGFRVSLDLSE